MRMPFAVAFVFFLTASGFAESQPQDNQTSHIVAP
jgi:hypothetical protein